MLKAALSVKVCCGRARTEADSMSASPSTGFTACNWGIVLQVHHSAGGGRFAAAHASLCRVYEELSANTSLSQHRQECVLTWTVRA